MATFLKERENEGAIAKETSTTLFASRFESSTEWYYRSYTDL